MTTPTAKFDRLLWLPKEHIDPLRVQLSLRSIADTMVGEGRIVEPWEETETHIGVPRIWGLNAFSDQFTIETDFTKVTKPWPAIAFPEGGTYRKGQQLAVETMSKHMANSFGGLLEAPCGSGKTLCGLNVAQQLGVPVLVLVHKNDLAKQWKETCETFFPGATYGHVQGDSWNYLDKHVVTAMAQTLYARQDRIPSDFMKSFGMVIFDEGHHYSAETFEFVLKKLAIEKRLGVSATWRRRDGLGCLWEWHIGKVTHRMVTTRLSGEYVQIPWRTSMTEELFYRGRTLIMAHLIGAISKSVPYNIWLSDQVVEAATANRRVLVVSDRIEQLLELQERIRRKGFSGSVGLYVGSLNKKRMKAAELESATYCDIILASYGMMSEGTDVPALDTLFLATPRSDVEQIVGRIQRPADDKKKLLIVDPVFNLGVCIGMAKKRLAIYETLNFKEHK